MSTAAAIQQQLRTYTPQPQQHQQNQQQQKAQFMLGGNNCVVNGAGGIVAPTCLPSTSAMTSSFNAQHHKGLMF